MQNIIILFFLTNIFLGSVYGQEISEEFYETTQFFENKISNDQILLSSNKSNYHPGEDGILWGLVFLPGSGERVFIRIIAPDGSVASEINVAPKNDGIFKVQQQIPQEAIPGQYLIEARYTESGIPISLKVQLEDPDPTITKIIIPFGASTEESGLNFTPKSLGIYSNVKLVWTNQDTSVHTVVSRSMGTNNEMFSDGKFDSGIISPNETFELLLEEEGVYNYFCRLHPWLKGDLAVTPSFVTPIPSLEKPEVEQGMIELILITDAETTTSWSSKTCNGCSANVTLSSDKKEGFSSVKLSVQGSQDATGPISSFDFTFEPIDLTNFDSLAFWIKTKGNSFDFSRIVLVDITDKPRVLKQFDSNSFPEWIRLNIPINEYVFQENEFDLKSVKALSFKIPEGSSMKAKQLEIFLDDINLQSQIQIIEEEPENQFLTLSANKTSYSVPETILISGKILARESDTPVTIQVLNPKNELIQIDQIVPNPDDTYDLKISTSGYRFQNEGQYKIIAQYGFLEHRVEVLFTLEIPEPFPVSDDVLLELWNKLPNRQEDYPEVADGNLERFKEWAKTFGWYWHESLSPLIPEGQTPQYLLPPPPEPFPVSDRVLFTIWNMRPNLQEDYPEVADGNLERFKEWAKTFGWYWHESLSPLVPEGQTPKYLLLAEQREYEFMILILILVILAIAGISSFIYQFKFKKIKS